MDMIESLSERYDNLFHQLTDLAERVEAMDKMAIRNDEFFKHFVVQTLNANAQFANGLSILAGVMSAQGIKVPLAHDSHTKQA